MKAQLVKLGERIRTSLWIIPAVCSLVAAVLAFVLIELDTRLVAQELRLPWAFQGSAEGARGVLSTIAGSMITLAGTIYSITFVVLVLASQQFAPRLIRNFIRNRSNQLVLGLFVATFTYCLLVLRAVRGQQEVEFVPHTAVTIGVALALVSLAMLLYFIDQLSHSIQVSSIIAGVVRETVEHIDKLYPDKWGEASETPQARHTETPLEDWGPVAAIHAGYLQYIDYDSLLAVAVSADLVIREEHLVGDFVIPGTPLAYMRPHGALTPEIEATINAAFALGTSPTMQQDIAYGVRQLVDVAAKGLSPAVNDPTTASNCIDQLGVILAKLSLCKVPDADRRDENGALRVLVRERTFKDLVRLAFAQITHFGAADLTIVVRMMKVIREVAYVSKNPLYRDALSEQLEIIAAAAQRRIEDPYEREVLERHLGKTREVFATRDT